MKLRVQGVEFTYRSVSALEGVDFTVHAGEMLAILGPNGAGKTTLLKCINGIQPVAGGVIALLDRPLELMTLREIAQRVGYVPQRGETAFLTVFDAVLMGRKPHIGWRTTKHDLKMVESALRRLHLEHLTMRPLNQLSGGELQQVLIARALVQEPELLLFDEPTSALDLKNQLEILTLIQRVVREHQVAAVVTMHDINSALRFADTVLFLKQGKVLFCGAKEGITAAVIEAVYGVAVEIHHIQGTPLVVPLSHQPKNHIHQEIHRHVHH